MVAPYNPGRRNELIQDSVSYRIGVQRQASSGSILRPAVTKNTESLNKMLRTPACSRQGGTEAEAFTPVALLALSNVPPTTPSSTSASSRTRAVPQALRQLCFPVSGSHVLIAPQPVPGAWQTEAAAASLATLLLLLSVGARSWKV